MTVTHQYKNPDLSQRLAQQAAIYRRCILLLRAVRTGGYKP